MLIARHTRVPVLAGVFLCTAPTQHLFVDPQLPKWLPDVTLRGLAVGKARLDLRVWRDDERTRWEASVREGQLEVRQERWQPWRVDVR